MHLLIPFGAPSSEAGCQALRGLALPGLQALLARCGPPEIDAGDVWSLSPPHERALARALGLQGGDGQLPWAARAARADGIEVGAQAWGLLSPTHWHLGTEQVSLVDPAALMLDDGASRALFDSLQPWFVSEGFTMVWGAAHRWYIAHDSLATLATASLDRVIARNVDRWLGSDPAARRIRRLQSEAQLLLHTHPVNAEREARGLLPVNSFWLSGCGAAQPVTGAEPVVDQRLRGPALAEDLAGWTQAWATLDAGPLHDALAAQRAGQPLQLTLCGERATATLHATTPSIAQRLATAWRRPSPAALLETL